MNIKRAKQEIIDAVEAYLSKDEYGDWLIPRVRQRPILLLGAPGMLNMIWTVMQSAALLSANLPK